MEQKLKLELIRKPLRKQENEGFSLLELVVVVAVLAVLSAIAIPTFRNIINKAKVVNAKTNLIYIMQECLIYSQMYGVSNPTFQDVKLGKTINTYGDSYGIHFGPHDGFTYNTSISSAMPTRNNSSCMRVAAKSHSRQGDGQTYLFPHFEIYYDHDLKKIQKNCVIQAGAFNQGNLCNTSNPSGSQW
tara:strand:+ start:152 stop:712 length:561 start_codon:yes stop_codon:yes gene_type:complete